MLRGRRTLEIDDAPEEAYRDWYLAPREIEFVREAFPDPVERAAALRRGVAFRRPGPEESVDRLHLLEPKRKRRMVGTMARCRNRKGLFIKCRSRRKKKCKTKCPAGTRRVCKGGFRKKGGHRKGRVCRKYVCRKT
jgi:hypothetical protein